MLPNASVLSKWEGNVYTSGLVLRRVEPCANQAGFEGQTSRQYIYKIRFAHGGLLLPLPIRGFRERRFELNQVPFIIFVLVPCEGAIRPSAHCAGRDQAGKIKKQAHSL